MGINSLLKLTVFIGFAAAHCARVEHKGKTSSSQGAQADTTMSDDAVADSSKTNKKEINQLKQTDTQLENQINAETKARQEADNKIQEDIKSLEAKLDQYKKELDVKMQNLDTQLKDFKFDVLTNYATKIELEQGLSKVQSDLMEELNATQKELILFQEYAKQTYATKEELAGVKNDLSKLAEILNVLKDKVTSIDKRENEHYSELIKLVTEVRGEIKIQITNIKVEISIAIKNGNSDIKAALEAKLKEQEGKLDELEKKATSEVARLEKELKKVEKIALEALELSKANKLAIEQALKTMDAEFARLNSQDEETKNALTQLKKDIGNNQLEIKELKDLVAAFKLEFDGKLDLVREEALETVSFLGEEVAKAFAQDNAKLTEKLQQAQAMRESFFLEIAKGIPDAQKAASFREEFEKRVPKIIALLKEMREGKDQAEVSIVNAVAKEIVIGSSVEIREHFDRFVKCDVGTKLQAEIPTIGGLPYFMVLAKAIANDILAPGRRTLPRDLKEISFLNHTQIADISAEKLFSMLNLALLDQVGIEQTVSCQESIDYWLSMVYESKTFITEINQNSPNTNFKQSIIELYSHAKQLGSVTAEIAQLCDSQLGSKCEQFKPLMAAYLTDLLNNDIAIMKLSGAIEDVYMVAKDVLGRISNSEQKIALLESNYLELKAKIQIIVKQVSENSQKINNAFYLIRIIAERLGFNDVAQAAIDNTTGAPDIDLGPAASCLFTQHRYIHHTHADLKTSECRSRLNPANRDKIISDCQIHALRGDNENPSLLLPNASLAGYSWGNSYDPDNNVTPCLNANGWQCSGQLGLWADKNSGEGKGQHRIQNGLKILALDPVSEKAQKLAKMAPGQVLADYPADIKGESTFVLDIYGNASKFNIEVDSMQKTGWKKYNVEVNVSSLDPGLVKDAGNGAHRYSIPLPKAIQKMANCHWERKITVTALDQFGVPAAQKCFHQFMTFSPVVLKLKGLDMIQTISPLNSKAQFDIDANGIKDQTGWINPDSGFLAIDLNGNGKIDDGRELFGEAFRQQNGQNATNGYAALASLDKDQKGYLSAKDQAFDKLLVWVDFNQNGKSESSELFSLKSLGISRIDTAYQDVSKQLQTQTQGMPEGNLVKYQSRYYGPAHCGKMGCMSYDVYFGKSENYVISSHR